MVPSPRWKSLKEGMNYAPAMGMLWVLKLRLCVYFIYCFLFLMTASHYTAHDRTIVILSAFDILQGSQPRDTVDEYQPVLPLNQPTN